MRIARSKIAGFRKVSSTIGLACMVGVVSLQIHAQSALQMLTKGQLVPPPAEIWFEYARNPEYPFRTPTNLSYRRFVATLLDAKIFRILEFDSFPSLTNQPVDVALSLQKTWSSRSIVATTSTSSWFVMPNNVLVTLPQAGLSQSKTRTSLGILSYTSGIKILANVLSLGLSEDLPSAVSFSEGILILTNSIGTIIKGFPNIETNTLTHCRIVKSTPGADYDFITYYNSDHIYPGVPTSATCYYLTKDNNQVLHFKYRIIKWKTNYSSSDMLKAITPPQLEGLTLDKNGFTSGGRSLLKPTGGSASRNTLINISLLLAGAMLITFVIGRVWHKQKQIK